MSPLKWNNTISESYCSDTTHDGDDGTQQDYTIEHQTPMLDVVQIVV